MIPAATSVLERAGEQLGEFLPRLGGALALLLVGLLLVRIIGRLLLRALQRVGLDRVADRLGVHDVLARAGLERSLSRLIALAVRVALAVAVIFAAVALTGLAFLEQALNEGVLFLPELIAALALTLAGLVLAGAARQWIERLAYQMDLRGPVGPLAYGAVLGVFAIMALAELGIPTAILTVLAAIIAGGAALAVALALGLGSREVAREVSAGRYVSAAFSVGQTITLNDIHGEIVAIESASTVIASGDGRTLRVPNHLFLEAVVATETAPGQPE